jgi:hypothetical protein
MLTDNSNRKGRIMAQPVPRGDGDKPITYDDVLERLRRARLTLGSIQEIGRDADVDLLAAEQAIRRAISKIDQR